MAPPKAAARNTLDLAKKVEVIHMYEKGSKSQQAIATEFGVGKTQISNILKRRREYLDEYEANGPSTKKRNCRKLVRVVASTRLLLVTGHQGCLTS